MNSSISSSEPVSGAAAWRHFLRCLLLVALATYGLIVAALLAFDPYDKGWFQLVPGNGIPRAGQRLMNVGLARNPHFDSAVFGDSTAQLLSPARLDALLGGHFAQLTIPGTGPYEQVLELNWFLATHPQGVKTLVFGFDDYWCDTTLAYSPDSVRNPFPFWLYGTDRFAYVASLAGFSSFDAVRRKALRLMDIGAPMPADGFNDYDAGKAYDAAAIAAHLPPISPDSRTPPTIAPTAEEAQAFVAFAALFHRLEALPDVKVHFLLMPLYAGALPGAGTDDERQTGLCKGILAEAAARHANWRFHDFREKNAMTMTAENFWDKMHYRDEFARRMIAGLAAP
jgi:hypothetical protein